jgi:hypothetical protein
VTINASFPETPNMLRKRGLKAFAAATAPPVTTVVTTAATVPLIGLPTVSCGGGGGEPIMLDADAGRRDNSFRRRSPRFAEIRSTKLF